jgi:hypothetical protein
MIINGGSRSNGSFFARHLMRADDNEQVSVIEMRGLGAETVPDAFREMRAVASGTRCTNYFYHANLNTRADERLTPEQWAQAVDALESELQLTDQPRFIVEHEKEGRIHRHVVWSRIDADTMTAISDSHNYRRHEEVATALEEAFGHEATARALTRDKDTTPRPGPNEKDWESFRAQESGIDPKAVKAELTDLWQRADSGQAFAAALEDRGYILVRGDRRDFCVIDPAGDEHSLARRIDGAKAAEIRARMADVDREALPSVEEGRALVRQRQEPTEGDASAEPYSAFDAVMAETAQEARAGSAADLARAEAPPAPIGAAEQLATPTASAFDTVMTETASEAASHAGDTADEQPGGRFERFRAWWGSMREYVSGWRDQVRDYWGTYFQRDEAEPELPTPQHTQDMEPQL